jgi:hypothetical protein
MAETCSALATYQAAFAAYLLTNSAGADHALHACLQDAPAGRTASGLRVYRNNVLYSLTRALAAQFPVVQKLVGDEFFGALASDYVRSEPPLEPALTYYGHQFAAFIARSPACRPLPYLADVARLELQYQRAMHAADDPVLHLGQLGAVAPELLGGATFTLHASVTLLASDYPIDRIWAANLDDPTEVIHLDAPGRHHLLIHRRALRVQVVSLQPPAFTLLQQLQNGQSLQQAWTLAAEHHALDTPELTPLLGYLLGLEVFSGFRLSPDEDDS